ncbi:1,4-dihydroxy-2-naphthoate octaprenyltransferase [Cellulophaga sp. 20_2_10]|uniref:1,4-dihydroxy-2-naphthoate octaprenyltransferase n=1 Tax=Cellulophaga sp. 20_2_10 TaxID=2942476 RepID=UPI00201A4BF5|nr:1,4-dihydroxy-2-naphthoate octaprenyltransferase [Cellulophaga sp. 20_2_10]MCL5244710.1 1,4-dihydroxy-2-naphthoate octaprenyltransferase [Cellulophaga sp. 20_2_10]
MKLKAWVNAARLRTLPLSVSGIIVGYALASLFGFTNSTIFIIALLTTVALQVTSNFANDYGDGVKGTDNETRIGPKRAYQSGILTRKELKRGIIIAIVVSLALIVALILSAFSRDSLLYIAIFFVLGVLAVWASIKYTVGESAYGYRGLGDVFVFIFFGLVSVLGCMFLLTSKLYAIAFLPAITVGLLSVAVLNLNNLRDIISDKNSGKNTIVVKMGFLNGKKYHYSILIVSFICALVFTLYSYTSYINFIWILAYIPIAKHFTRIVKMKDSLTMDPELKIVALSSFLFAILFYFSFNIFL